MSTVNNDIDQLIQDYLDGLYRCDTTLLARVFHPQAIYATAVDATPLIMNMATYLPVVAQRDPPARQNAPRRERILHIERVGPSTAFVKLECSFFQKDYTDLLSLICVEGRWQIISKVFHYTPSQS